MTIQTENPPQISRATDVKTNLKPATMNILTFDIEDWFHILDNDSTRHESDWSRYESRIHQNMDKVFDLLDGSNQRATFFCLGWVARKYPDIIRRIDAAGYEIASHSDLHQLVYTQKRAEYRADLERSIRSLEDLTGKKVITYRAPGFSLKEENDWVFEILLDNGIERDCSIFPARRSHGGYKGFGHSEPCLIGVGGATIKEFPMNSLDVLGQKIIFSGGGYFRLLPLSILRHLIQKSDYVMTYFHPRDFDPEQPTIDELNVFRRFKSYVGLKTALPKLKELLKNFEFMDLETADAAIDWSNAPIKKI